MIEGAPILKMGISIRAYACHRGVTDTQFARPSLLGGSRRRPTAPLMPSVRPRVGATRCAAQWHARPCPAQRPPCRRAGRRRRAAALPVGGGASLLQARTVNEVVKAQTNKVRLARLKGRTGGSAAGHRPRFQAGAPERDAWLNWPARIRRRWRPSSASIRTRCTSPWGGGA